MKLTRITQRYCLSSIGRAAYLNTLDRYHLFTVRSIFFLSIAASIGCAAAIPSQQPAASAVIIGRVVNHNSAPLPGAAVFIEGTQHGTVAKRVGEFVLQNVPRDQIALVARSIGHHDRRTVIRLESEDTLRLTLRLWETQVPIAGGNLPYPDPSLLQVAEQLIPRVLADTAAQSYVRSTFPGTDSLLVWARWSTQSGRRRIGRNPAFIISRECAECALSTSNTIEGGSTYVAGIAHLNMGISSARGAHQLLEFCLDKAKAGDTLWVNCSDISRPLWIRLERGDSAGDWVVLR